MSKSSGVFHSIKEYFLLIALGIICISIGEILDLPEEVISFGTFGICLTVLLAHAKKNKIFQSEIKNEKIV